MKICGLDCSLNHGAAVVWSDGEIEIFAYSDTIAKMKNTGFGSKFRIPKGNGKNKEIDRLKKISVIERFVHTLPECDLYVLENYAHNKSFQAHQLGEVGYSIKRTLYREFRPFLTIPPTVAKKALTGKGNADKLMMVSRFCELQPEVCETLHKQTKEDAADAYALIMSGIEEQNEK